MSDVLVRDMEMPKNCYECSLTNDGFYLCKACPPPFATLETDCEKSRPGWCPLISVPTPHGRLIDADKLMRDIEEYHLSDGKFQHLVEVQQTIIEAEGSDI